jgi:hypothetical protein
MLKSDSNSSLEEIDWHEKLLNWSSPVNNMKNEENETNARMLKCIKNISIIFGVFCLIGIFLYFYSHYL